ncbi:MAG: oxidoreductase [Candidatus Poribacteria bacterium]|nr:MAG: oxidoreductase [Candidatus Poribacteria bacterium]
MRIALIGCGRISHAHLQALAGLEGVQVVALCDTDETLLGRRQEEFGVSSGFSSLEELLDWGRFEVAGVLTPPHVRKRVCLPLIRAGKHLLVEKPFGRSLQTVQAIVEMAEAFNVRLAVDQNFRWMPPAPQLREAVGAGRLGRVLAITIHDTVLRNENQGWRMTTDQLALGVMGVHWFDRIRWITRDEPLQLFTVTGLSGILESHGEDLSSTTIRMRSGIVATLVHHWASHTRGASSFLQLDGSKASAVVQGRTLRWFYEDGTREEETLPAVSLSESIRASWNELLSAIRENREPVHSGRDNLWTMAMLDGAYRSAAAGSAVDLISELAEEEGELP